MPSNWLHVDTNFPAFTGEESTKERLVTIENYMYLLVEQLRYTLFNLDLTNMNATAVERFEDLITEPIYARIEDDEGKITELSVEAGELATRIRDAEGNLSMVEQDIDGFSVAILDVENAISSLELKADSFSTRIQDAEGNISALEQTATEISGTVGDLEVSITELYGLTVTDAYGTTRIRGSSIETDTLYVNAANVSGTLSANSVFLNGLLAVCYGSSVYGYIGASTASSAMGTGVAMCDSTQSNGFLAMTTGARMQYSGTVNQMYVSNGSAGIVAGGSYYQFFSGYCYSKDGSTLGTSAYPWDTLYAGSCSCCTSDREKKKNINYEMDERYDMLWDLLKPCTGKYTAGTSNRTHMFLVSQDVEDAIEESGLTSQDFAAFIKSPKEGAEGYDYALRYEEFIPLCIRQIQKLQARVAELEELA